MAKDPNNALVWFATGQVYAGLLDFPRADSAFRRAEELYPLIAADVNDERIRAWGVALNAGVDLMERQAYDLAIEQLEGAELVYAHRPESKINLAILYANKGDVARAETTFRSVLELLDTPRDTTLSAEEETQWARFKELSTINLASILGQRGVEAFQAERYDDAIAAFREAHGLNAQTRDFSYNLAESIFAKARKLEEDRKGLLEEGKAARAKKDVATANARVEEAKKIADEVSSSYAEIEPLVTHALTVDPNNKDLYLLQLRSYQVRGELATDAAAKAGFLKRLNELLAVHQELPVEITNIAIGTGSGEATLRGELRNLKLAAGTPVKVHMTLLGLDGSAIGEQEITVTAPATDKSAPFEATAKMAGELAGWKYVVMK
jgi:tetratricopeptide (TPR) repeat protein